VYRAFDRTLRREVAVKRMLPGVARDAVLRQRFLREVRALASLRHPCVIPVYDVCEDGASPYYTMPFLVGKDLGTLLREGRLSLDRAFEIAVRVADGLQHVHDHGIVHRDVKPGNVFVPDEGQPVLMDFGLALAADATRVTGAHDALGTLAYMAPELFRGRDADRRSDVYALGVTAFEMFTGVHPFEGALVSAMAGTARPGRPSALVADLPPGLDPILLRAITLLPAGRYPTAGDFGADLALMRDRCRGRAGG
jgi:serine/threonine-protein kinase